MERRRISNCSLGGSKKTLLKQAPRRLLSLSSITLRTELQRERGASGTLVLGAVPRGLVQVEADLWGRVPRRDGQVPQCGDGIHGELPHWCAQLVPGLLVQQHLWSVTGMAPGSCQRPVPPDPHPAQALSSQGAGGPGPLPQIHQVSPHLSILCQLESAAEDIQAL